MNKLSDKFKTAEKLVAYCLKNFEETRGNDKTLRLKVWDLQGFRLPKKLIPFFYKVLDAETISRVRRRIQGQGLFRAESLKTAQRSLRSMEHRQMFRKKKKIAKEMIKQLKEQRQGATNIGIDVDASIKALKGGK